MAAKRALTPLEALEAIRDLSDEANKAKEQYGLAFAMISADDIEEIIEQVPEFRDRETAPVPVVKKSRHRAAPRSSIPRRG